MDLDPVPNQPEAEVRLESAVALTALQTAVAKLDPEDLATAATLVAEHKRLARLCASPAEAALVYGTGEAIEQKLRIGRAKFAHRAEELFQTGFLLRALSADLPANPARSKIDFLV